MFSTTIDAPGIRWYLVFNQCIFIRQSDSLDRQLGLEIKKQVFVRFDQLDG